MKYEVRLKKRAIKALENMSEPYYSKIKTAIYLLAENSRAYGYIQLKGRNGYRIRIGDYRVIYEIVEEKLLIEIVEIGHRKDIYQ